MKTNLIKKIRNKITLNNILTLLIFFVVFIAILLAFEFSSIIIAGQTYLKDSAQEIVKSTTFSDRNNLIKTDFHNQLGFEYIISQDKKVVETDCTNQELVNKVLDLIKNDDSYSLLENQNEPYRVYQTNFVDNKKTSTLYVFQNITAERNVLLSFLRYSLIMGVIAIIGLIPVSFYLSKNSLKAIEKNYEQQNQFISEASHELRSPLNVIQTNVDLLLYKENETIRANKEWFNNIVSETQTMSHLIENLLEIARNDDGRDIYLDRDIILSELLQDIVYLLKTAAKEKNIEINTDIDYGIKYYGDSEKLRQLFRIFIDNAIKYSIPNSSINVSLKDYDDYVQFIVEDTGIGISESDQEKIFERFYRCDNARSRKMKGTGLGLNIAKNIVNNYEGTISVDSKINEGSTFIISLPM